MTDDRTRCKQCYIYKRRLGWKRLVKKNKVVLIFVGFLWLYAVFPGPLIPGLDPGFYAISIVAAVLIMIPIGLALFFWSLNPPASDVRKRKD
jgi:membrane protease YdiL (CAAX protease family)